jgi:catabolite regulation protein CreA
VRKQGYDFVFLMRKSYTKSKFAEHKVTKAQDVKRQVFIKLSDPHKVEDTRIKPSLTNI